MQQPLELIGELVLEVRTLKRVNADTLKALKNVVKFFGTRTSDEEGVLVPMEKQPRVIQEIMKLIEKGESCEK